jgi:hypothetical protein
VERRNIGSSPFLQFELITDFNEKSQSLHRPYWPAQTSASYRIGQWLLLVTFSKSLVSHSPGGPFPPVQLMNITRLALNARIEIENVAFFRSGMVPGNLWSCPWRYYHRPIHHHFGETD